MWRKREIMNIHNEDDDIQEYVRPWIGLTNEEQREIAYSDINCWDWGELMDAVEAKLKEKNT